ncbi:MAG: hypothetical protein S4CHLAM81_12950 [Chlamydiales bacterium]|nr:hypothetical protein [Chlamydiales bacterium]MCH9636070.1 hypothetical protein [Chlamydiales bacterium]MCH9703219.1 hypothetical protein [Chlamydiota bacterium]
MKQRNSIVVLGCSDHFRARYFRQGLDIRLIVDLKSREKEIRAFFGDSVPMRFLPESMRYNLLPEEIETIVDVDADCCLISTDPSVHLPYVLWAKQRGIPIFMDKPVSASSHLLADFEKMEGAECVLSCERRAHQGYDFVRSYLQDKRVTSVDINFGGGVWNLPDEYLDLKTHPFHMGYGILLHSGYHYIDLLAQRIDLSSVHVQMMTINPAEQTRILGENPHPDLELMRETDCLLMGKSKEASFSVQLRGTSLSLREGKRGYKLPGKVRQERVTIHCGMESSLQIESLPCHKIDGRFEEKFSVTILERGRVIEKSFGGSPSLNKAARRWQFEDFLRGGDGRSPLSSHRNTVAFLDRLYSTEMSPGLVRG